MQQLVNLQQLTMMLSGCDQLSDQEALNGVLEDMFGEGIDILTRIGSTTSTHAHAQWQQWTALQLDQRQTRVPQTDDWHQDHDTSLDVG